MVCDAKNDLGFKLATVTQPNGTGYCEDVLITSLVPPPHHQGHLSWSSTLLVNPFSIVSGCHSYGLPCGGHDLRRGHGASRVLPPQGLSASSDRIRDGCLCLCIRYSIIELIQQRVGSLGCQMPGIPEVVGRAMHGEDA